jgi:hypothetical protein
VARSHLVSQRQATANTIRGLLKTFGLVVARGSKGLFSVRVRIMVRIRTDLPNTSLRREDAPQWRAPLGLSVRHPTGERLEGVILCPAG